MAVTYSAAFARGYLRRLYRSAQASGQPLLAALMDANDVAQANLEGGKALIGTAANGRTASFILDGVGLSPRDFAELTSRLLDKYDIFAAELGNSATDAAIYTAILNSLQPVTRFHSAFYTLTR